MKGIILSTSAFAVAAGMFIGCTDNASPEATTTSEQAITQLIDVAQTSGQLASGTSFRISGSSTDSTGAGRGNHKRGPHRPHRGILDGVSLLAPTNALLAIIDAESAGDFRGLRISGNGGATITHYNAQGQTVTLAAPRSGAPNGCSFSGNQYPLYDSLLSTIVKTEIDFGTGVTFHRDTITITRAGKVIITRSGNAAAHTEVTTFENYSVNGAKIEGTKTRTSTFDSTTGLGSSITTVTDGKITFADGIAATWTSDKERTTEIVYDETANDIVSGTITTDVNTKVTAADGTVIYVHNTTAPLIENLACEGRRHGPVSGTLETVYGDDTVVVDYGDGSCTNRTITITLNGVVTTKTIGG